MLLLDSKSKCMKDELVSRDYSTLEYDDISSLIFNNPITNATTTHLSSPIQQPRNILVIEGFIMLGVFECSLFMVQT
jgi:hypothetical protein